MTKASVFLSLGSNLTPRGTRREDFLYGASVLTRALVGTIIAESSLYETTAVGIPAPDYLNQVLSVSTSLGPGSLLTTCLRIEQTLGRLRGKKWEPRNIDIDVLYYEQQIISTPRLQIPHPRLAERRFVLVPMAEIAPNFIHPVTKKTQAELLHAVPADTQKVEWYAAPLSACRRVEYHAGATQA